MEAVIYLTRATSDEMTWLDQASADQLGINYVMLQDAKNAPKDFAGTLQQSRPIFVHARKTRAQPI